MNLFGWQVETLKQCVVVGGSGAVGGMFARLLALSGAEVTVVDTGPPPSSLTGRFVIGDITAPDRDVIAELRAADLILLAVPEPVALAALPAVVRAAEPDALLAHTLSVQSRMARALSEQAPDYQAVGLNPMFAPSLGITGRPVAAAVVNDGPRVTELLGLVSAWGGRVMRTAPERHDRLAAVTQALTHAAVLAFGLAMAELDTDIEEVSSMAPPPHQTMLALLARVASGAPEVYWDVQVANPYARDAREALRAGILRVAELAASSDEAAFAASLGEVGDLLGSERGQYRDLCAEVFGQITMAGRTS
jgi:prephenate dehydrogenase